MRNYLFSLIACCALTAPFQAAACACANTYADGGYIELPNPPYPERARLKNEQGIVKLARAGCARWQRAPCEAG